MPRRGRVPDATERCGTVGPEQNRRECIGIPGWSAANAEVRGSSRFCGATYGPAPRSSGHAARIRFVAHRIAVIPGDGISKEVIVGGVTILEAIGGVDLHHLPWSADHYLATGETMPANGYDTLRSFDAILVGALGDPRVPDNRHARDILLGT